VGHRELFRVENEDFFREITTIPDNSIITKLYNNYKTTLQSPYYYNFLKNNLVRNFISEYIIQRGSKRISGTPENILLGRGLIQSTIDKALSAVLKGSEITKHFPDMNLDDDASKQVMQDYLALQEALYYLYVPTRYKELQPDGTGTIIDRDYIKILRNSISSGTQSILRFGTGKGTKNPLLMLDKDNPASGFRLPLNLFSKSTISKILWTLDYSGVMTSDKSSEFDQVLTVDNIEEFIKDPIKDTYDFLYNVLWNFKDAPAGGNPIKTFYLTLYRLTAAGVQKGESLLKTQIRESYRGSDLTGTTIKIELDRGNQDSIITFRKSIASVIKYMVKYNAFISIKTKLRRLDSALYISQLRILSQEYMTTTFYGDSYSVQLTDYAKSKYDQWTSDYKDTWNYLNIFPIYLFSDAENFDTFIVNMFQNLATIDSDSIYAGIDNLISLS